MVHEVREELHTGYGHAALIGTLSASFLADQPQGREDSSMDIKQPSATFPGFRHIHRSLMPGETIPRAPTLLEQLQALGNTSGMADQAIEEEEVASEVIAEEQDEEEWPEVA
jgi:hypothetical protein